MWYVFECRLPSLSSCHPWSLDVVVTFDRPSLYRRLQWNEFPPLLPSPSSCCRGLMPCDHEVLHLTILSASQGSRSSPFSLVHPLSTSWESEDRCFVPGHSSCTHWFTAPSPPPQINSKPEDCRTRSLYFMYDTHLTPYTLHSRSGWKKQSRKVLHQSQFSDSSTLSNY